MKRTRQAPQQVIRKLREAGGDVLGGPPVIYTNPR